MHVSNNKGISYNYNINNSQLFFSGPLLTVLPITCNKVAAISISTSVLVTFPLALVIGFLLGVLVTRCWAKSTVSKTRCQNNIVLEENEAYSVVPPPVYEVIPPST